jgi:hydroxyacylglutathione hydrolase
MKVAVIAVTAFQQNCSLLICEQTNKAAIVDPGGDLDLIREAAKEHGVELEKILLTHGHIDHCGGAGELASQLALPVEGPNIADEFLINALPQQSLRFGFPPAKPFTPGRWLVGGETVRFGQVELEVRHCPGHTPGHVIFFNRESKLALVGDVLFAGSIGRTDLPGGNHASLIRSIREELWPLGNDVTFIPGHGPASTFADERAGNPFVGDGVVVSGRSSSWT